MGDNSDKFDFSFQKEALPHLIDPYQRAAEASTQHEFVTQVPYPFLLYVQSTLWDPLLIMVRQQAGPRKETALVDYNIQSGGLSFLSPIKKRQTDPDQPAILLGRDTKNDLVVPVSSISSEHVAFIVPAQAGVTWAVRDLGATNGTFLGEEKMEPNRTYAISSGDYLRLGGNLLAWFFLPDRLWEILTSAEELERHTEV